MRTEALLVAVAAVLLTATVGAAIVVPDDSTTGDPPGELHFGELTIDAAEASGETVELDLDVRLAHHGGVSENVSVELRAIDDQTGLREDKTEMAVESVEGDRELALEGSLSVDRAADYELEAIVYEDERRVAVGHSSIAGLESVEPDYADTSVAFHRFTRAPLPSVEYEIRDVVDDETTLATSAYLTNAGSETEGDLEVRFVARQADSSIVADSERVSVDGVAPGETVTPEAVLEVPDGYNYHLDAIVHHEGVIVDTAREPATLDPDGDVPESDDANDDGDGLETEDFRVEDDAAEPMDDDFDEDERASDGQPGFGTVAALLALLLAVGLVASRRDQ